MVTQNELLISAMELGYKAHSVGWSIEKAREELKDGLNKNEVKNG